MNLSDNNKLGVIRKYLHSVITYKLPWNYTILSVYFRISLTRTVKGNLLTMSYSDLFEVVRERLARVDLNNRKVVAVFQVISGDQHWGECRDIRLMNSLCKGPSVFSLWSQGSGGLRGNRWESRCNCNCRYTNICSIGEEGVYYWTSSERGFITWG